MVCPVTLDESGDEKDSTEIPSSLRIFFFHRISFIVGPLLSPPFNTYYFKSKDQNKLLKNYLAIPFFIDLLVIVNVWQIMASVKASGSFNAGCTGFTPGQGVQWSESVAFFSVSHHMLASEVLWWPIRTGKRGVAWAIFKGTLIGFILHHMVRVMVSPFAVGRFGISPLVE